MAFDTTFTLGVVIGSRRLRIEQCELDLGVGALPRVQKDLVPEGKRSQLMGIVDRKLIDQK